MSLNSTIEDMDPAQFSPTMDSVYRKLRATGVGAQRCHIEENKLLIPIGSNIKIFNTFNMKTCSFSIFNMKTCLGLVHYDFVVSDYIWFCNIA